MLGGWDLRCGGVAGAKEYAEGLQKGWKVLESEGMNTQPSNKPKADNAAPEKCTCVMNTRYYGLMPCGWCQEQELAADKRGERRGCNGDYAKD